MMIRVLLVWSCGLWACGSDVLDDFIEAASAKTKGLNKEHPEMRKIDEILSESDRERRLELALAYVMERNKKMTKEKAEFENRIVAQMLNVDCSHIEGEEEKNQVLDVLRNLMSKGVVCEITQTPFGYRVKTSGGNLTGMSALVVRHRCRLDTVAWFFK